MKNKIVLVFIFLFISTFFIEEVKAEESINSVCVEKTTTIYEDNKWFESQITGKTYDFTNLEIKSEGNIEQKGTDYGIDYNSCFFDITFNELENGELSNDTYSFDKYGEVKTGLVVVYKNGSYVCHVNDYYEKSKTISEPLYQASTSDLINGASFKIEFYYEINSNGCVNYVETYEFSISSISFDIVYTEGIRNIGLINNTSFSIDFDYYGNEFKFTESNIDLYKWNGTDFEDVDIKQCNTDDEQSLPTTNFYYDESVDMIYVEEEGIYKIKISTYEFENQFFEERIIILDKDYNEVLIDFIENELFENRIRVFDSESNIPVYEKGLEYDITNKLEYLELEGKLINLGNNEEIIINKDNPSGVIDEDGVYKMILQGNFEGDNPEIEINFSIAEKGASTPYINYDRLKEFNNSNISNYKESCFVASFKTKGEGNLNVCFTDEAEATNFYMSYKESLIADLENVFVYNGTAYKNKEDIINIIKEEAKNNVYKHYFEMSDPRTYNTLSEEKTFNEIVNDNLLIDTFMFYNEDVKNNLKLDEILYLAKMPYMIDGEKGYNDFIFIKDKHGYISNKIIIMDEFDNQYEINYFSSVIDQLESLGCKSGMLRIVEASISGEVNLYTVKYINEFDLNINTKYEFKNEIKELNINEDITIEANNFNITEIINDVDNDFYAINVNNTHHSSSNDKKELIFNEEGIYIIKISDRFGNCFTINLMIYEKEFEVIIDDKKYTTSYNEIINPDNEKVGYEVIGYIDNENNNYDDLSKLYKPIELRTVYIEKEYTLVLKSYEEPMIKEIKYSKTYELPILPSSKDYKFIGFVYNDSIITKYTHLIDSDITLEAKYEKKFATVTVNDKTVKGYVGDSIEIKNDNPFLKLKGYKINDEFVKGNLYTISDASDLEIEPVYTLNPIMYIPISIVSIGIIGFVIWRVKKR